MGFVGNLARAGPRGPRLSLARFCLGNKTGAGFASDGVICYVEELGPTIPCERSGEARRVAFKIGGVCSTTREIDHDELTTGSCLAHLQFYKTECRN